LKILILFVLICISLTLQSPVSLSIHNQYQDINLISPVYFTHDGKWNTAPDQEINVNAVMRNLLEVDPGQNILEGALVYRIQKKHVKSDKSAQYELKCIQLLVAWRIEYTRELRVRALLVEHDNEFNWDEDKLKKLHQKYWRLLKTRVDPIENNWLLHDTTVLKTTIKVVNGGYRWDIFISEGAEDNIERPLWIDAER
jgi:hypothetical protein